MTQTRGKKRAKPVDKKVPASVEAQEQVTTPDVPALEKASVETKEEIVEVEAKQLGASFQDPSARDDFKAPDFNIQRQYGFVGNAQDQIPSTKLVHRPDRRGQYAGFTWVAYRYWGNSSISYYPVHHESIARTEQEGEEKGLPYLMGNWQIDDQGKVFYPNGTPRNGESVQMAREYLVVYDLNEAEALNQVQLSSLEQEFDGKNQSVYEEDVFGYGSDNFQAPIVKNNPDGMEGYGIGQTEISVPSPTQDMASNVAKGSE